jgi:hypothetical protein
MWRGPDLWCSRSFRGRYQAIGAYAAFAQRSASTARFQLCQSDQTHHHARSWPLDQPGASAQRDDSKLRVSWQPIGVSRIGGLS